MLNKDDYMLRIAQATPAQLVVINYEILAAYLADALDAFGPGAAIRAGGKPEFERLVDKSRECLRSLMFGLNLEITIAQDLFRIYTYINKLLNTAFFSYSRAAASEALELTGILLTGWRETAKQDENAVPAADAPQVYAGLTYQRDGLSEYIIEDTTRGYKA